METTETNNAEGGRGVLGRAEARGGRRPQPQQPTTEDPSHRLLTDWPDAAGAGAPALLDDVPAAAGKAPDADMPGQGQAVSWPPPGQYGTGHVNLRPKRYVLQLLKNCSWVPDSNATRYGLWRCALVYERSRFHTKAQDTGPKSHSFSQGRNTGSPRRASKTLYRAR